LDDTQAVDFTFEQIATIVLQDGMAPRSAALIDNRATLDGAE
jgi:hypothetical protein